MILPMLAGAAPVAEAIDTRRAAEATTLIIPIVALAMGRAFLGETVTPTAVVGIITVLFGVGVALLPEPRQTAPVLIAALSRAVRRR